jgi:hypothetical protein
MKRTLQCPKCESRKLWHLARFSGHDGLQLALEYERLSGRGAVRLIGTTSEDELR